MRAFFSSVLAAVPLLLMLLALTGAEGSSPAGRFVAPDPVAGAAAGLDALRHGDDDDDDDDDSPRLARFFVTDPLADPDAVLAGAAAERLTWNAFDAPAFPGDRPGSLTARYDARADAGRFGYRLPRAWSQEDTFTAAAVFIIDPATFSADPNGFFQISWGLWNSASTGLNRTGDLTSFAADTYELIEFDWFPNVSEFFGGPFLAANAFGVAAGDPPDAFSNATFLFGLEAALPLGVPLLATLEHRPGDDALVTQVYRVLGDGRVLPVDGAVGVTPLDAMPVRVYTVDTVGLTLWRDGFSGPTPSVLADVTYHSLVAEPGAPIAPEALH